MWDRQPFKHSDFKHSATWIFINISHRYTGIIDITQGKESERKYYLKMIFKNVWNLLNVFDKTELAFEIKHLSLITSGFKSSQ